MTSHEFPEHNDVMVLLYGHPSSKCPPEATSILSNIDGLDEAVLPLLKRLLTTGSARAREDARNAFLVIVTKFQTAYDESEYSADDNRDEQEDRWERFLDGYENPVIRNSLLRVWNASNVIDEAGSNAVPKEIISGMGMFSVLLKSVKPDYDEGASNDYYWRGLAATAIVGDGMPSFTENDWVKMDVTVPGFIEWAGNHEDITTVIDVARERDSFDRDLLEGIIAERGEKTALSSGVL